ncbi:MAG: glycosyltransferase family protein [Saprospiraceae bacterium]|nr:glycosyltransferase family protein [Lewinella sp.]
MEDGPYAKLSVIAVIQARMASTRLPGKVLMPIPYPNGQPLIQRITQNLKGSRYIDHAVVATSEEKGDDPLVQFLCTEDIDYYRGSHHNVFSRFLNVAHQYKADHIVRLTGDNPFLDVEVLDQTIEAHVANEVDYTATKGLPLGMNLEIVKRAALSKSAETGQMNKEDEEHVTAFIKRSPLFTKQIIQYDSRLCDLRLTIDYPSDFALVSLLYAGWPEESLSQSTLSLLENIYDSTPWLFEINEDNFQKVVGQNYEEEKAIAIQVLNRLDLGRAAQVLEAN